MEQLKAKAENLTENIGDFIDSYYKLTVLKAAEKATTIASVSLVAISIVVLGIFVLFFSGIALGVWLGGLLNNTILGFLLVAAFYLLIMGLLIVLRRKIVFPAIRNIIIRKVYE